MVLLVNSLSMLDIWQWTSWLSFSVFCLSVVYIQIVGQIIIIPLFEKGNQNDPDNYRGITLCDISSKLYSSIINNRLQEWIEENNLTGECQAGFKKDYSTVDHMFTLMAMIQKQFALNRKLYVAFIDLKRLLIRYRENYFGLFF